MLGITRRPPAARRPPPVPRCSSPITSPISTSTILGASLPARSSPRPRSRTGRSSAGWRKLQRSVFIDRNDPQRDRQQRDAIERRLDGGRRADPVPGRHQQRRHSCPALQERAVQRRRGRRARRRDVAVQPVSVAYTRLDGMPLGRFYRPFFAWYGDMEMAPHLWAMLGLGRLDGGGDLPSAGDARDFASRKELAEYCRRVVGMPGVAGGAGRAGAEPCPSRRRNIMRRRARWRPDEASGV